MKNFDNRRRAFADVVTIDAWHSEFGEYAQTVDLHADIVFGTSRVGGEEEAPVRFRLSVRRAEVVLIIPESEPVSVDRTTVSRDAPESQGHLTETLERSTRASAKAKIAGSVSSSGVIGSAEAEAGAEAVILATTKMETSGTVQFMLVTQSKTAEGHYRWTVTPRHSRTLDGRPWDGAKQPRLKLIDKRSDRSKGIPPTVRFEVRCRREDLVIEDLEIKNELLWDRLKAKTGFTNRLAAAESYIRDRLAEEGFAATQIDEKFAELIIASATAETN